MLTRFRTLYKHLNPELLLVLLFSLIAAWAFIMRPSLPRETDTELHVFRAAELGYTIRAGDLYPRWAPDFYYGYGYPIFNYYAPLTYYLANLLSLTIPGGAVLGVKMVFVLGFVGSGLSVYGLVRRLSSSRAGLIAASSYLFAPYVHLIDPHLRGDLAEFFGLAVGPFAFWALTEFFLTGSRRNFIWSALSIAALILTHTLLALVYFAMIIAYTLWYAATALSREKIGLKTLGLWISPLLIGLSLAAFYWLPVGLERNAVQLGNLIGPGHFDFRNHFLTLADLFGPSIPLDLGAVNPAFRFNLGIAQWLLAGVGLIMLVVSSFLPSNHHAEESQSASKKTGFTQLSSVLFWLVSLVVLVALMLPLSSPIWDSIPVMPFLQFPWRLLGPAALCVAILGGQAARLLELAPPMAQPYSFAALTILPLVLALPVFIPPGWGDFGPTDQLAMLEYELNGLALGTTSTGDFVPVAVDMVPGPNPDLIDSYRRGGPVDKVNRYTLPEGASIEIVRHRPTADVFVVDSPDGFLLRLYTFMFDGWRATVDGEPTPIEVAKPEGFITVPLPPGKHTVRVWLGATTARTIAVATSLVGIVALALIAWRLTSIPPIRTSDEMPNNLWPTYGAVGVFIVIAVLGGWSGAFQPHSSGLIAIPAEYSMHNYLQGGVDLIGFDLPVTTLGPGESVPLTLYWKAREPVQGNYQVFVHLISVPHHIWAQSDKLNPGDYPSTRWPLDRYIRDPHTLTIPPGTLPGEYTLLVGLWNHTTGVRQLVLAPNGDILGDSISLLVQVTVLPASEQPTREELQLAINIDQEVVPGLTLLGANQYPGDIFADRMGLLTIELYWRVGDAPLPDYSIALRIVDIDGNEISRIEGKPADGRSSMSEWTAGLIARDIKAFWIEPDLPTGRYTIEVGLVSPGNTDPETWGVLLYFDRVFTE